MDGCSISLTFVWVYNKPMLYWYKFANMLIVFYIKHTKLARFFIDYYTVFFLCG